MEEKMTDEMKRKLNWRAFLFIFPFSVGWIYLSCMLIFVWKPDQLTESAFSGAVKASFFMVTPALICGTVATLFAWGKNDRSKI
jgi:hypothetical protein